MTSSSNQNLLKALQSGSETAFKKVYQDNRQLFVNFGRKYGLNDPDILDVYQDAYIAFYENVVNGKLKELTSSVSTYLISIGKYKIMDRLRKKAKERPTEEVLQVVGEPDIALESFELNPGKLSTEQHLLRKHFLALGPKCRAILTMFYYKKYNIRRIMEEGGYNSENVVKSQKSRCLKSLREAIQTNLKGV